MLFKILVIEKLKFQVHQWDFHGGENQLWNISYDIATKQAIISSVGNPDCVLDVEGDGGPETLCINEFEEDKPSQLWRYKKNYFFNQGNVLDVPFR